LFRRFRRNSETRTLDFGPWTLNLGPWTLDFGLSRVLLRRVLLQRVQKSDKVGVLSVCENETKVNFVVTHHVRERGGDAVMEVGCARGERRQRRRLEAAKISPQPGLSHYPVVSDLFTVLRSEVNSYYVINVMGAEPFANR
ncbi:MAG TPA: hypothetical protein VMS31_09155, partial [Pyrinomonadaceae bacterium]|nr:hypothetical protein [Pyrinomonadaceae bacterium]